MNNNWIEPSILEDTCDETTIINITRQYTNEELNSFKVALSDATIESMARTKALADIKKEFEITQDPELLLASVGHIIKTCEELTEAGTKSLNTEITSYIDKLKSKEYTSEEEVYVMKDYDNSKITYYDSYGDFVSSRPMRPDERQTNIKNTKYTLGVYMSKDIKQKTPEVITDLKIKENG